MLNSSNEMKSIIVDIQCFKKEGNQYVVKELAGYDGTKMFHYIFKPPFRLNTLPPYLRQQVHWLSLNHHCIDWSEGFTPAHTFPIILKRMTTGFDTIYVKGLEKSKFIKQYIEQPVLTLEEQPALEANEPSCFHHLKSPCICALTNVYQLYDFFYMKQ